MYVVCTIIINDCVTILKSHQNATCMNKFLHDFFSVVYSILSFFNFKYLWFLSLIETHCFAFGKERGDFSKEGGIEAAF